MELNRIVTTPQGVRKMVVAQTPSDLASATSTAKTEARPKTPDINDKAFANKRQKDL